MNSGFCCSHCTVDLRNIVLRCRGMKPSKARLMCSEPVYESEDEHVIHTHLDALLKKFFPRDPRHRIAREHVSGKSPQSALVLCPSDVLTAFYALYPKHRPKQSLPAPSTTKH